MSDLFWPGDERAGELFGDLALLRAMTAVEAAWLETLAAARVAPEVDADLAWLVGPADLEQLATGAEAAGNPVLGLVALLRSRTDEQTARWLHRGLTSQDVLDTALILLGRELAGFLTDQLAVQVRALTGLAEAHRGTPMIARTLTQPAVPTSFGAKAAAWLTGLLDAAADLRALRFPVQAGGAAGTLAAVSGLGGEHPLALAADLAERLGLDARTPWHTARAPITRLGDTLTGLLDASGHIANDVLLLGRAEIGEVAEPSAEGRGGSSTMPQKANPVLSVLVRRAALTGPALAATLHVAAADAHDERTAGGWHAEWATLRTLGRRTAVAASQTTELLTGLVVHPDRMAAALDAHAEGLLAEARAVADLAGRPAVADPRDYLGASGDIVDAVIRRARAYLEESP